MGNWFRFALFLSCCYIAIVNGFKTTSAERAAVIEAAIIEAKEHASQIQSESGRPITLQRQRAFKLAYPGAVAQGKARVLFEDMVHRAEKKILHNRRTANTAALENHEAMAEALAMELLHTPGSLLTKEEIAKMYEESECQERILSPNCGSESARKYHTADGTCNNLNNPTYGAANTPFRRLILPQYEDGVSALRGWMQSTGSPLFAGPFSPPNPSPRVISVGVVRDRPEVEDRYTHILMQWGQFMDHDLDLAPELENCPEGCNVTTEEMSRCAPFPVPFDDTNLSVTRTNLDSRACHAFRRSLPACDEASPTEVSHREQINAISAYIDGSQVYSHDENVMNNLIRDKSSGKGLLRTGLPVPGTTQPSLPFVNQSNVVACPSPLDPTECYLAGDVRVNEQTALTVMHTIWVREHNRIAMALSDLNPQWDEEKLFQEARKIVIAQIQKITYKDYLPLLLGDSFDKLILDYSIQGYNDKENPNIPNAFATAAYRYGHSQIQPFFDRLDNDYNPLPQGPLNLVDAFFLPSRYVESGGTDPILRGLVTRRARFVDEFLNNILTNQLFATNSSAPGMDLASLNIQRGRDHGLPPYLTWKRWASEQCGIESDFSNELTKIHLLQTYGSLETVDLFVGGLAEEPLKGGLVGATFACIFARTFQAVRDGDRFYYENADRTTGTFTAAQRAEIEKASLSRVICDNSDNIQMIQPNAFLAAQGRVSCSDLPQISLNAWQETSDICYTRVGVTDKSLSRRAHRFEAFSRFEDTILSFHFSRERVRRNQDFSCLSIQCPQQGRRVVLSINPISSCSLNSNRNLPPTDLPIFGIYAATLDTSHVSESNGLYLSKSSCSGGSVNAVDYKCTSFKAKEQDEDEKIVQSLEEMLNAQQSNSNSNDTRVDEDIKGDDPVFNDISKELRNYLFKKQSEGPTKASNEKLISVMESVLKELKSQESQKSADEKLLSELSEQLAKI